MANTRADSSISPSTVSQTARSAAKVIIIGSALFTFISYWRTAAVVLCDLASTAYYIGGIVEQAIGPAAPWFILAVMVFSYAVRAVYIESSSLFVRGGVYRVVKEAMGGFLAKLAVSALMFDYILTGPTSGVSAGQYLMGVLLHFVRLASPTLYTQLGLETEATHRLVRNLGAVLIACAITLYFFRQNLLGMQQSSGKALKIMIATTIMAGILLTWCLITLAVQGPRNRVPWQPDLDSKVDFATTTVVDPTSGEAHAVWVKDPETGRLVPRIDPATGQPQPHKSEALAKLGIDAPEDPLGLLARILPADAVRALRHPPRWLSLIGVIGLLIAFGHSILAMSGEETLAQVYREVEAPKLPNFKKAAFIIFVYSLVFTAGISFLAVMLIPDEVRMKDYSENLIGGLARYVLGPPEVKLALEAFVVIVGFMILAGAVNTALIGSNGVLNRVAEDGVLPDWFLRPHPRYGTTYRVLVVIVGLQLAIILISHGDVVLLGEAYAFGVVWSFVFMTLAMVVLRFKAPTPREFKVPLNFHIGSVEVPAGLILIFLILLITALLNLFTKEVATVGGLLFTGLFLAVFTISERYHEKRRRGSNHEHLEQFNRQMADQLSAEALGLHKPYRKLVAIRSPQNLAMIDRVLAETDPDTTDVVVLIAKQGPPRVIRPEGPDLDRYDQQLLTAVVDRAERAGKEVKPVVLLTNNPLYALLKTARDLRANELILGTSTKYTADAQLELIRLYWASVADSEATPLTVRIRGRDRDVGLDLNGGSRIPRIGERGARSVAELRRAGVGAERVLLAHDGTQASRDLLHALVTVFDPQVQLTLVPAGPDPAPGAPKPQAFLPEQELARQLGRTVKILPRPKDLGTDIVRTAQEGQYDLIIVPMPPNLPPGSPLPVDGWHVHVLSHAPCPVLLAAPSVDAAEDTDGSAAGSAMPE